MKKQTSFLKEGWGYDRATSKPVDMRKPEEAVRQKYEQILHNDYGYDYSQMDIEVFIKRGSKVEPSGETEGYNRERADIVIYHTTDKAKHDQNQDIAGIVETKRPDRKDGVKQLSSYLSASSGQWGVWTNGDSGGIEYLYHEPKTGAIRREFIFDIPKNGENIEEMGRLTKARLIPATDLKLIFRRILNTLYANTNISRREKLGSEMIRLIFAKIWDERYDADKVPKFRISTEDTPDDVKQRIQSLFSEVKQELVADDVFEKNEEITLDPKSIAWVAGQLQRYSLLKTDKDAVGDAFEVFAESKLVGEKGEFFTPREVVKTAVALVNPQPQQSVVDPACGSGGFLIHSLEHVWDIMGNSKKYKGSPDFHKLRQEVAEKYFYGIDKEIDLVKIAKAYMAIVRDGRGGIVQQNTLHMAEEYDGHARDLFTKMHEGKRIFRQFNIILTNPPFGSKSRVLKNEAAHFTLGCVWKRDANGAWQVLPKPKDTEPQVLFVERCLDMLCDGGTLAIVLPETYFHSPSTRYVREYIKRGNNIKAVVDLPHNTFRPHCNAKTLLLIVEKGRPQQQKVIFAVAEEMGHNHQGKPIYRYDDSLHTFTDEIWDDTKVIREELDNPENPQNKYVFTVNFEKIINDNFVPRYYWTKKIKGLEEAVAERNVELVSVGKLLKEGVIEVYRGHGAPPSGYKGRGEIPYVRASDVVGWELYKNPTTLVPENIYQLIKGKGVDLKEKDIVFVKEGSYRIGSVAMVSRFDTGILLNHHSIVFRVLDEKNKYGIDAFYLLYLFSHELTQKQLFNKVMIDTTLPNIGNRWKELYLPIAKNRDEVDKIRLKIKSAFEKKWGAIQEISELSLEFGNLTT
tara:strand:+ start:81 stop:2642 length:2562 start_codon:yes stop_codon:yes gene_type:complete